MRKHMVIGLVLLSFVSGIASTYLLMSDSSNVNQTAKAVSPDDYPDIWKREPAGEMFDSWNMQSSNCTSWVAWKLWQNFHYSVDGWGDANEWLKSAEGQRPIGNYPVKHSVAVDDSYTPGHVMWVEEVYDDGKIKVSEYNFIPGDYSERIVFSGNYKFIYFN